MYTQVWQNRSRMFALIYDLRLSVQYIANFVCVNRSSMCNLLSPKYYWHKNKYTIYDTKNENYDSPILRNIYVDHVEHVIKI